MSKALSPLLSNIEEDDFSLVGRMVPPLQRKAYSDRTAWLMATLADMAYEPFELAENEPLKDLAEELAHMQGNVPAITEKLENAKALLNSGNAQIEDSIRSVLAVGGFELIGTFFSRSHTPINIHPADFKDPKKLAAYIHDTQGFVAARRNKPDQESMAVLVFRGTTNIKDWITNANAVLTQAPDGDTRIHPGFRKAYEDVQYQVLELLKQVDDIPLYITGHSLGGALAVCATYFLPKHRLAACYTFGGPRVGDQNFVDRFKTPIYRVVNGYDPVPMIPPSATGLYYLKFLLSRVPKIGTLFPWLSDHFSYAHAGDQRYLSDAVSPDGFGRKWQGLRLERNIDFWARTKNFLQSGLIGGGLRQVISYHTMSTYRKKLRFIACEANPQPTLHAVPYKVIEGQR